MSKALNYYSSLDEMPIYNWRMINETNNLEFLLKKKKKLSEREILILEDVFATLYDSFLDTFGISDTYRRMLELKRDIAVLQARMVIENDRSLRTDIRIADYELKELNKKGSESKQTFIEVKAYIEKFMGFRINQYETSVTEYYSYLDIMKKNNK